MLEEWIPYIKTITANNGKEFTEHKKVLEQYYMLQHLINL